MTLINKREPVLLLLGDLVFFALSLWIMLFVRKFELPEMGVFEQHLVPFMFLFLVWILIFYISGLYEKHTLILKNNLPSTLFNTLVINSMVAVLFFYFIPMFGIAPKTNLFIYLFISFGLILFWRLKIFPLLSPRKKHNAILIGSGEEMLELKHEVNNNSRYDFNFVLAVDLDKYDTNNFVQDVVNYVYENNVSIIVADIKNPNSTKILPALYNLIFAKVQFLDKYKVYETLFDRIPLSMIGYNWFLENISSKTRVTYDFLKRLMDILMASVVGIVSLVIYPLVYILIKREDGGSIFYHATRLGKNNKTIKLLKFRTMTQDLDENGMKHVTKIGKIMRGFRIDELPQLWNVLKGDLSLIGPRPETPDLVEVYTKQIPYYSVRHLIQPGLSGWAQIYHENHPHHSADVKATKEKLSYDLYYIKNRSILLDLRIALKTLRTILTRKGK